MRGLSVTFVLAGLTLAGVASCASPNPDLFTLAAVPGAAQPLRARTVELRRVGLAAYLDRPEIVRSDAQYRLQVSSTDRWGEPMGSMLERVFTEDLVQRLPNSSVFSESGAISTRPDLVLEVDVQRLDANASGDIVLLAQVAIQHQDSERSAAATQVRLTVHSASIKTTDLVAAMSAGLGQLADEVVHKLADNSPQAAAPAPVSGRSKHGRRAGARSG